MLLMIDNRHQRPMKSKAIRYKGCKPVTAGFLRTMVTIVVHSHPVELRVSLRVSKA